MKSLLILILLFIFIVFCFSGITAIIAFFIDVMKWHKPEQKTKIVSSAESEVKSDGRYNSDGSFSGADGSSDRSSSGSSDRNSDGDSGSSSGTTKSDTDTRECDARTLFDFGL